MSPDNRRTAALQKTFETSAILSAISPSQRPAISDSTEGNCHIHAFWQLANFGASNVDVTLRVTPSRAKSQSETFEAEREKDAGHQSRRLRLARVQRPALSD